MRILGRLALLFVVVPVIELALLIQIGQLVGLLPTVALVVFTGVTGAWLARAEGLRVFFRFQQELAAGRLPGQSLLDGIAVLVGGAFLLTPGVLTDVVGFSLLLPVSRHWIQRRVRKRLERGIADGTIRVMTTGSMGGFGFGGRRAGEDVGDRESSPDVEVGERAPVDRRSSPGERPGSPGLDSSKGIVIEEDDG